MNVNELTYYDFIIKLSGFHKTLESVLVFFKCNNNRAGRIAFDEGNIFLMRYANKKGNDAINNMSVIQSVSCREERLTSNIPGDNDLIGTDSILQQLLAFSDGKNTIIDNNVNTQIEQPADSVIVSQLSQQEKDLIEKNLIKIIGPMGAFLCKKHVHPVSSLDQAMVGLSTALSDKELNALKQALNV